MKKEEKKVNKTIQKEEKNATVTKPKDEYYTRDESMEEKRKRIQSSVAEKLKKGS